MKKDEFLRQLKERLSAFSDEEVGEVISFYEENILDRMDNGEEEEAVIASYGPLSALGSQISEELKENAILEKADKNSEKVEKSASHLPRRVEVQIFDNTVIVRPAAGNEVSFRYVESAFRKFVMEEREGVLSLASKRLNIFQHFAAWATWAWIRNRAPVEVFLPESFGGELSIDTSNGKIIMEQIPALSQVQLTTNNGRIEWRGNCRVVGDAELDTDNGRIEVAEVHCGGKFRCNTDNGRIEVDKAEAQAVHFKTSNGPVRLSRVLSDDIFIGTSNGAIELGIIGNQQDYRADCRTSNGKIDLNGLKITSQTVNPNGTKKLTAKTSNGKINITFTE